jgi:glutamate/tyrosine decarboxylase-like PLP-dependent enzyme
MSLHERGLTRAAEGDTAVDRVLDSLGNQLPALVGVLLFVHAACARSKWFAPQDGYYDDGWSPIRSIVISGHAVHFAPMECVN